MRTRYWIATAILITFFAGACKSGRPTRKTLPDDFNGSQDISQQNWEAADGRPLAGRQGNHQAAATDWPFYSEKITFNGKPCTVVYLPNPQYDSLVWNIIRSYEPFALSVMDLIASQGIQHVAIDLRQNTNLDGSQAEFTVSNAIDQIAMASGTKQVSVRLIWDNASASRASAFMNELKSTSQLSVREIGQNNPNTSINRQDCFSGTVPSFDE